MISPLAPGVQASSAGPSWLSPAEQTGTVQASASKAQQHAAYQRYVRKLSTTDDPLRTSAVDRGWFSMEQGNTALHFASLSSAREQVVASGVEWRGLTAWGLTGSGEKFSVTSDQYAGLDPYKFHGGSDVSYRMVGTGLQLDLAATSLQFGSVTVSADRLEDRRSTWLGIATRRYYGRYTMIERGGDSVGHGFDAGLWLGRFKLGYQELATRQEISTRRLRLEWRARGLGTLWLDYSRHRNALFADHEDDRVMLTFQRRLGQGGLLPVLSLDEAGTVADADAEAVECEEPAESEDGAEGEANPACEEGGGGFRTGVLIAGGAAAGALIASSGSDSQDEAPRVNLQHEAARAVLNVINPLSVAQNLEYGAYIYRNPDGSYASTDAVQGTVSSVALPPLSFVVPPGSVGTASWHTHAGPDPRFDNENFSQTDLESDRRQGIDGYLGTPAGQFKYHDIDTGVVSVIGTVNN